MAACCVADGLEFEALGRVLVAPTVHDLPNGRRPTPGQRALRKGSFPQHRFSTAGSWPRDGRRPRKPCVGRAP
eukprot:14087663-Alexandrium_andersonii.AAC.1